MKFAIALFALVSVTPVFAGLIFSDKADIDRTHTNIHLADVKYLQLPSKTEIRQRPGCMPYGDRHPVECQEEVVLERQPAVVVDIVYTDGIFHDSDVQMNRKYLTLNLRPEMFSAEEIAELEKASKFSFDLRGRLFRARKAWMNAHLDLETNLVVRNIQVVDMRTSRFCTYHGDRYPDTIPGCVEVINYKPGTMKVREVKVLVK